MEYQLADLYESVADHIPDREALVVGGRRFTYRSLDEAANQFGHALVAHGIAPDEHIGFYLKNHAEYTVGLLGATKASVVPVNVNWRYVQEELRYLYDDADLAVVLVHQEFLDRHLEIAGEIDTLRLSIVVGAPEGADLPDGCVRWEDAVDGRPTDRPRVGQRSGDDRWMIYTGGTTGMPKGVNWRHEDLFFAGMGGGNPVAEPVATPEELAERIDADADFILTMFAAPPLMHGAAQLGTFIGFWQGSRVVQIPEYSGHGAMQLMDDEKVNTISIVGDAMALPLIEAAAEKEYDTSQLFVLSTAGAIMSKTVVDKLKEVWPNAMVLDSFGSSETGYNGSAAEGSSPDEGLKFTMDERFAVISDDLRIVQPGEDTEGYIGRRGHIPLGYYKDEKKTAETFKEVDGERWVLMGDRATVDADGIIHVLGRGSVCINSGGEKIFPEEVEAALKTHPAIADAVVAGVADERFGQRVSAVLQLNSGADAPAQDELEEHLSTRLARYKVPRLTRVVDQIQRSPAGKPDYKWARAQLEEISSGAGA